VEQIADLPAGDGDFARRARYRTGSTILPKKIGALRQGRDGFVMGEAQASWTRGYEHAKNERQDLCEVIGYGLSGDGLSYHLSVAGR